MRVCCAVAVLAFCLFLEGATGVLFGQEPGFRVVLTRKGLDYGKAESSARPGVGEAAKNLGIGFNNKRLLFLMAKNSMFCKRTRGKMKFLHPHALMEYLITLAQLDTHSNVFDVFNANPPPILCVQ